MFFLSIAAFYLMSYGKVQIHLYLNQLVGNPVVDYFFYFITYLGDGAFTLLLLPIIFFYNIRLGICAGLSFGIAALSTNLMKYGFYDEVVRPWYVFQWIVHEKINYVDTSSMHLHNSFPSGHATQAFAIFFVLALYAKNLSVKYFFLAIALLTAFSRVYLSQHWLVDITIGSLVGSVSAIILFSLMIQKNKMERLNVPLLKLKNS